MRDPTCIILLILHQADVALLQVREIIKDDKLYLVLQGGFEFQFDLTDIILGIAGCILSQFLPITIEVGIKFVEAVKGPQKILVLHPVFTKRQL